MVSHFAGLPPPGFVHFTRVPLVAQGPPFSGAILSTPVPLVAERPLCSVQWSRAKGPFCVIGCRVYCCTAPKGPSHPWHWAQRLMAWDAFRSHCCSSVHRRTCAGHSCSTCHKTGALFTHEVHERWLRNLRRLMIGSVGFSSAGGRGFNGSPQQCRDVRRLGAPLAEPLISRFQIWQWRRSTFLVGEWVSKMVDDFVESPHRASSPNVFFTCSGLFASR